MRSVFKLQKILTAVYVLVSIAAFIFALSFMTEYGDLFGLRLPLNKEIAEFHDVILQIFNRQILIWSIVAVAGILLIVMLEVFTKVPDRLALVVMVILLAVCCYGAFYGLINIPAIRTYYQSLDFQYLYLEGLDNYQFKFTTFNLGMILYSVQMVICVSYALTLVASHIIYMKTMKKGAHGK